MKMSYGNVRALGAEQVAGQPEGVLSLVTADVDISKLPSTFALKLYGRDQEMAKLVAAWDGGFTRIFGFDAMGGAGKTALVYHFVQALKASGWRGARSIFAWSFYSQGSNEDRHTRPTISSRPRTGISAARVLRRRATRTKRAWTSPIWCRRAARSSSSMGWSPCNMRRTRAAAPNPPPMWAASRTPA
jgi:hypothetical protein